ncbi:hypothetical protein KUCAC02_014509 [Chaenocephalus aceratus]|uniref:Uncharacterized protein n=1 Tax=Chaenocephalus aceratus TaxID=36190 RepID=A0ACB9WE27_CHAAC|nr:hypothetical protein KUCAC02_014509 [Chaenocephalus aceratus]
MAHPIYKTCILKQREQTMMRKQAEEDYRSETAANDVDLKRKDRHLSLALDAAKDKRETERKANQQKREEDEKRRQIRIDAQRKEEDNIRQRRRDNVALKNELVKQTKEKKLLGREETTGEGRKRPTQGPR